MVKQSTKTEKRNTENMDKSTYKKTQNASPTRVNIHYWLEGKEAERFLEYMRVQHLNRNAVAGRKLMLERLEQVEAGA